MVAGDQGKWMAGAVRCLLVRVEPLERISKCVVNIVDTRVAGSVCGD